MKQLLPKTLSLAILVLIANLFFTGTAIGQTNYYYKGTGNLNSVANWGTNTNGTGSTPSNFTTANRIFNIRNVASVSNSGTWTVSGAGSKIVVGDGTNACNLTVPTGSNTIVGTVDVSAGATLTLTNTTLPTLGTLNAASTVIYNASGTQSITAVTYGNLTYSGSSTGTFAGACTIAGDFSCTSGSVTFNSSNSARTFTISGDFSMSAAAGTIEFGGGNGTSVINLSGNFSKTNGYMVTTNAALNADFNMVGSAQTMQSTGGTIMKWVDFTIANGSVCTLSGDFNMNGSSGTSMIFTVSSGGTLRTNGFNIIGSATGNTFTLSSGGTLEITSTAGITTAGTASGNIQSLVRTYNAGANYTYNGSANQATGTGYPTNLTGILTIDNPGNTVTLSAARTIASGGTVALADGTFAAGTSLTMATTSSITRSEGAMTGTLQGTGTYNVTYTGNSKTGGPELTNGGLNNLTLNLTSGQTATLAAALALDGTLTIGSGSTLDVSGSNFAISIAGSWTNNGGTFTAGTGTVTFNGTGAQSINGTATSQSFNNVIVNKTAGQLLNTGGSTVSITTKDLTLTQGNFTSPATLNINGNLVHTAGTFTAGANINITGNWTRNGGTFTNGSNTVTFTGSSAQLINGSNATGFHHLVINETAAATTVTSQTTAFTAGGNLTVTQGNLVLQATNTDYTVSGNVSTAANGTLTHSVNWDLAGKLLQISGSLTIDGTFTYTVRSHIQMIGAGAKTIKSGTSAFSILTLLSGTFTASGIVNVADNFYPMYNSTGSFSTNGFAVTASSSCLNFGGIVNVNGGSLTVTNGLLLGSSSNPGTLNLSSGTLTTDGITIGDATTNAAACTLTQTGGTLQVNGAVTINQPTTAGITNAWNINAGTPTVTGLITFAGTNTGTTRIGKIVITTGTLNANGGFSFAGTTPATKVIDMSTGGGTGTINMKAALTGASAANLTAGTSGSNFNYADNTSAQTVNFFGSGAYHNLYINTTGGAGATLSASITAANVTGNLRVQTGTLSNGGFAIAGNAARTLEVANAAFLKIGGTTSAFPTVFGTVTLGATSTVDYNGSGAQTIAAQNYGHLTTTLNGTRTITLANAGTIGIAGVFSPAAGTTSYTVTGSTVNFNGTSGSQNIPAFTFNNLSINNAAGVALTGNVNANTTLTMSSGNITCSGNTLSVVSTAPAAIVRTAGHVIGNLQRGIATGANTYSFPVGTASGYTPASLAFTAVGGAGNITLSSADAVGTNYPASLNATKRLARNWPGSGTVTGITGSATFTYLAGDLVGGAVSGNLKAYVYNGSHGYPTSNGTTASSFTFNDLTTIGEFGAGECKGTMAPTFTKTMASSCGGGADGTITVTPAGGTAPYTYSWSSTPGGFSAATAAITGLSSRDYTVVVSEVTTCSTTIPDITIWQALLPVVTNNGGGSSSCSNTGYITLYGSYGVPPFTYSINGSTYQASNSFINLAAGTYTGYVMDSRGCVGTKPNIVVNSAAAIVVTASTKPASSCANNGSIELFRTGGVPPFTYSLNDVTYQSSNVFSSLAGATTYTGWVKDSKGCKTSLPNITVAKAAAITVTALKTNTSACANTGFIQIYPGGGVPGYTYSITGSSGPWQTSAQFTGLAAGTYNAWVQDSKGCKNVQFNVIIATDAASVINVTSTVVNANSCIANSGAISLFKTGGVGPFTYSLNNVTYQSSNVFTGLTNGTYTGWVKDSKGCTGSQAGISVTQASALSVTESHTNSSVCVNDGTIQLRPAGGVAPYTYSLDDITYQGSGHFSGQAAGSFTGWVKDAKGCKSSVGIVIATNTIVPTAYVSPASNCGASDGSIQIFRTGGVGPFTYSLDGITYQSGNTFTGLVPGDYDAYVKDSKGCFATLLNLSVGPNCPMPFAKSSVKQTAIPVEHATKMQQVSLLKVKAYPNPSNTAFTLLIQSGSTEKIAIRVTDIMGRQVHYLEGKAGQQYRFGEHFIPGIYFLQLKQGAEKQSIKLVKE